MSTNTEDLVIGEGDVAKAQELHQRGLAAEAEGDRIAAIEAYREAVTESPLTESRFRLAWLLFGQNFVRPMFMISKVQVRSRNGFRFLRCIHVDIAF